MPKNKAAARRRSGCPLNASVEMLGDRWSLLVIRDMMIRGYQSFHEFLHSDEKIATNILADRLHRLEEYGIISARPDPSDGRRLIYFLTQKGIDLAPVLAEMVLWAARHEETGNQRLIRDMKRDKEQLIADVRKRWDEKHKSFAREQRTSAELRPGDPQAGKGSRSNLVPFQKEPRPPAESF